VNRIFFSHDLTQKDCYTANSRRGSEAVAAGLEAAEGQALMLGVHGPEEDRGRHVMRLLLPKTPF
jgi:hypothetical protein